MDIVYPRMRKQTNSLQIRTLVLDSGERLPLLIDRATGVPLHEPTLYTVTRLRTKNLASATIYQHCIAIMVLTLFLQDGEIDLNERMASGRLLTLPEIESLVRYCRLRMDEVVGLSEQSRPDRSSSKVISLERLRMRRGRKALPKELASESAATRRMYIGAYLQWLVDLRATDTILSPHPALATASAIAIGALREHLPPKHRQAKTVRKGFAKATRDRILLLVVPRSEENPWSGSHCQYRNELVVRWLLHLGVRRGEILGIQTSDIDFQRNEVLVARRADDVDDPRRDEPNTKTFSRVLPLSDEMAALSRHYILKVRNQLKGARKHKYLLVADGTGAPLGKAAFAKIFSELRAKFPKGASIHPHLFRHTWNDDFSEQMDRENIPEDRERKLRSMLMGWSPTSDTAETYTKRHIEKKAKQASLDMQNKSMKDKKK
ncbi:MAG: site-specific integrase [Chitinophagaceae bacterium]|nr:MAG: site-specific integrase [Chitinophagaceae bacterium]